MQRKSHLKKMANSKVAIRKLAELTYLYEGKTQKDIATTLGVSIKTVNLWAAQDNWAEKKETVKSSPEKTAQKLNMYLNKLFAAIDERELPITSKEADTIAKLIAAQHKLRLVPSQMFQAITGFLDYMRFVSEDIDGDTLGKIATHFQAYMEKQISEYDAV